MYPAILEDLDHLDIGPRTDISSQCVASQNCSQGSHGSDSPDAFDTNDAEEDDMLEEDSDEDDCTGTDTGDDNCDILHTLRRSPPRHIADPLVRDFAHVTQRLLPDSASAPKSTEQVLSFETEEQVACQVEVEVSEPVQKPSIDLPLATSRYAMSSNSSLLVELRLTRASAWLACSMRTLPYVKMSTEVQQSSDATLRKRSCGS